MKKPEEIKKGLECCYSPVEPMLRCEACPYCGSILCKMRLHTDAITYIQQLERDRNWLSENYDLIREENKRLEAQNAELVRKTEQLKEGTSFTLTVKEQDVKGAVKKAYESMEIDGKKLSEWIKLLADYKRHEWISAKEPPKEWRNDDRTLIRYLVYIPEYGVDVGNYLGQAKTWICMGLPCKVTYWMPLPEPPMEETGHV